MPEVSLKDWKQFIDHHSGAHLLQAAEWGDLKAAFGWDVVRVVRDGIGAQVLFRRLPLGLTVAYIPKPAFNLMLDMTNQFWQELAAACSKNRAVFLKIEPDEWESAGADPRPAVRSPLADARAFRRSEFNIQPPRTLLIDLRGSEDWILGRMKQKCRYNIRLAEKKGIIVRPWTDLDGFHELMRVTGQRDAFGVHSADYYRNAYELFHPPGKCELLVAEYESTALAALMVFRQGTRAWYLYGASNDAERNRMPTYLLQWEAMRWARAHGCEQYDLWGVPDEDAQELEASFGTRHDGLWGVYRFKRGFGGELKRAAQAIDVVFNPLLYQLYLWRMAGRAAL
jgi:lipid II:glycine glycyltransferase (peptidoglycan interpeptide bridge formation enzyme)